jgi:hypothetical protein
VVARPGQFVLFAFTLAHLVVTYGLATIALWSLPRQTMAVRGIVVTVAILTGYLVVLASRHCWPSSPAWAGIICDRGAGVTQLRSPPLGRRPRPASLGPKCFDTGAREMFNL